MTVLTNLRAAMLKRAEYTRTKYEISNMPYEVAVDLGIFPEDAPKIASKAVYG